MSAAYRSLSDELNELERTNPKVRAAALKYDIAVSRILGCNHIVPCKPGRGCTSGPSSRDGAET